MFVDVSLVPNELKENPKYLTKYKCVIVPSKKEIVDCPDVKREEASLILSWICHFVASLSLDYFNVSSLQIYFSFLKDLL